MAQLRGAYEDAEWVYITMEWCTGGELWHRIGRAHYSEQTVRAFVNPLSRDFAACGVLQSHTDIVVLHVLSDNNV